MAVGYEMAVSLGIKAAAGSQIVVDYKGNVGLLNYEAVGGGFPSIGFHGGSASIYFADEIWDLEGYAGDLLAVV